MKTVLMHSYVDEHEHVTGKRFGERLKTRFQSCIFGQNTIIFSPKGLF